MILAPFCVIGMWEFGGFFLSIRKELAFVTLVVVVLVPYFLFQTNFVYEVADVQSWSVPLSGYRMNPLQLYGNLGYIDDFSVYGARGFQQILLTNIILQRTTALHIFNGLWFDLP